MTTADPQTPTPPKRRGRRLARIANVKSALADVIRKLEAGDLDVKRGNALVYALSVLAGVMQGADIEERISALERAERARDGDRPGLAS